MKTKEGIMVELRMLNGGPNFTVIETFSGQGILIAPGIRRELGSLEELKTEIAGLGIQINVTHIHGSPALGRKEKENRNYPT
jgi:hypothetical protein